MPRSRLSILLLGSLPGDEQLLQQDHEGEEQNAQHRDGHDRSKETGFVQLEVEEAELVADAGGIGGVGIKAKDAGQTESCESGAHRVPAAAGHPLAHDGADEGQRRGDFERGEEERYGRWKAQQHSTEYRRIRSMTRTLTPQLTSMSVLTWQPNYSDMVVHKLD